MSKNLKKKLKYEVLGAIKQQKPQQVVKKAPQFKGSSPKPKQMQYVLSKKGAPTSQLQKYPISKKKFLDYAPKIARALKKDLKQGKIDKLSVTRRKGRIIGINYDYTNKKNKNKLHVMLKNDQMTIRTRQLVGQVNIQDTNVGVPIFHSLINPTQSLGGIREKRFASCFDKYDITKCTFRYNPASATTVSGSFFGGFDFDPTQYYPPSSDGLNKLLDKPGSHECMFYGGGRPDSYVWKMPSYPGTPEHPKPTFFVDQTDNSGSAIRLANIGEFRLLNGFGIKGSDLGIMGSIWCEMETKFYDPFTQNIDGTQSTFYCINTTTTISLTENDKQGLVQQFSVASDNSTAGVEWTDNIPVLGQYGWYVPPGVWTMNWSFNDTMDLASNTETVPVISYPEFTLLAYNVTQTDWKTYAGPTGGYTVQPVQYLHATGSGIVTYPKNKTVGTGKFIVPNDGIDYYFTLQNTSRSWGTDGTTGVLNDPLVVTVRNDITASVPSFINFEWHSPNAFEAPLLSPTANVAVVDRITALEKKLAALDWKELNEYKRVDPMLEHKFVGPKIQAEIERSRDEMLAKLNADKLEKERKIEALKLASRNYDALRETKVELKPFASTDAHISDNTAKALQYLKQNPNLKVETALLQATMFDDKSDDSDEDIDFPPYVPGRNLIATTGKPEDLAKSDMKDFVRQLYDEPKILGQELAPDQHDTVNFTFAIDNTGVRYNACPPEGALVFYADTPSGPILFKRDANQANWSVEYSGVGGYPQSEFADAEESLWDFETKHLMLSKTYWPRTLPLMRTNEPPERKKKGDVGKKLSFK